MVSLMIAANIPVSVFILKNFSSTKKATCKKAFETASINSYFLIIIFLIACYLSPYILNLIFPKYAFDELLLYICLSSLLPIGPLLILGGLHIARGNVSAYLSAAILIFATAIITYYFYGKKDLYLIPLLQFIALSVLSIFLTIYSSIIFKFSNLVTNALIFILALELGAIIFAYWVLIK